MGVGVERDGEKGEKWSVPFGERLAVVLRIPSKTTQLQTDNQSCRGCRRKSRVAREDIEAKVTVKQFSKLFCIRKWPFQQAEGVAREVVDKMVRKTPKKGGGCGGCKGEEKLEMQRNGRWETKASVRGKPRLEMVTFWAGNMGIIIIRQASAAKMEQERGPQLALELAGTEL